jgi:hypothetical protein
MDQSEALTDPIIHSHLLLSTEKTKNYTRIFNLRKDPLETILSRIIVDSGAPRHLMVNLIDQSLVNQEATEITPFFYKNQSKIDQMCKNLIYWHNFYQFTLTKLDAVVVYETMVKQPTTSITVAPIYPNKEKILLNYDEIVNYIQKNYLSEMVDCQQPFLAHQGVDVYKYINW